MTGTALITGASSGIGREMARLQAARGGDLVVVARRQDALNALKSELEGAHGITVDVIAADLCAPNAAEAVHAALDGREIDILINNAGLGGHSPFLDQDLEASRRMMALNMCALTDLCHLVGTEMRARGRGRILNVASTAAFLPGPLQAVYYATKAYVTSFSQALAEEMRGTGVTVTALCPGPVKTGFAEAADLEGVAVFDRAVDPHVTARAGYDGMMAGKLVVFDNALLGFALAWVMPLLPRRLVLGLSRRSMEKA